MATMPFVRRARRPDRKPLFPVSWLIQARLARVATVVDENINGVRIVKAFAAEGQQLRQLTCRRAELRWAYRQDAEIRARWSPTLENLPRLGLALVLLSAAGWPINGHSLGRHDRRVQLLRADAAAAVPDARHDDHARPAGRRVRPADLRGPRHGHPNRRPPRSRSIWSLPRRPCTSTTSRSATRRAPRCSTASTCDLAAGETWRSSGAAVSGKSTLARLLARFYDVNRGVGAHRRHDVRDVTLAEPARPGRHRARRAVPVLGVDPRQHRLRAAGRDARRGRSPRRAPAAPTNSSASCPRATTRWSASAATRCPAGTPAHRDRPGAAGRPAVLVLDDATSAIDAQSSSASTTALDG